ncbi:MAG: DUF899 family protein [Proteobacteria bacterium]|nr:DUF899 family protein [Pseudomonadota bacterium]
MAYRDTVVQLNEYRAQITGLRGQMRALQSGIEPETVPDYAFMGQGGAVRLSELFGDKQDLFVIHNMGRGCVYCTMWADGFNGVLPHLENRAAFAVSSPDAPEVQKEFADSRGWRFKMISHQNTDFAADMGYKTERGFMPGVSVFRKDGGQIMRVSDTGLGPDDDFCAVWHFLDMLPAGADGWRPRYAY